MRSCSCFTATEPQVEHTARGSGLGAATRSGSSLQSNQIKVTKDPVPKLVWCLQTESHQHRAVSMLLGHGSLISLGMRKGKTLQELLHSSNIWGTDGGMHMHIG